MSRGFSPLERRILLALVSLIRDRNDDEDPQWWDDRDVPVAAVYGTLFECPGDRSYALARRNQRQAQRRALGRLAEQGFVYALALAWVDAASAEFWDWQGGGRHTVESDGYRHATPRWRRVGLTNVGIKAALLLEQETAQ